MAGASEGQRVRITSDGNGARTVVTVGGEMLTNVHRIELTIDAQAAVHAVLHLYDVDVDVDLCERDVVAMLTPVTER